MAVGGAGSANNAFRLCLIEAADAVITCASICINMHVLSCQTSVKSDYHCQAQYDALPELLSPLDRSLYRLAVAFE